MHVLHIKHRSNVFLLRPEGSTLRFFCFFTDFLLIFLLLFYFVSQLSILLQNGGEWYTASTVFNNMLGGINWFFTGIGLFFHRIDTPEREKRRWSPTLERSVELFGKHKPKDKPWRKKSRWIPLLAIAFFMSICNIAEFIVFPGEIWWPLLWSIVNLMIAALSLAALLVACIAKERTRRSIDAFSIALSEEYITREIPFRIFYILAFAHMTKINTLRIWLHYREHRGQDEYGDTYHDERICVQDTGPFMGYPSVPVEKEFPYSLPFGPARFSQGRKNWYLSVYIYPQTGSVLRAQYSIQVIDAR